LNHSLAVLASGWFPNPELKQLEISMFRPPGPYRPFLTPARKVRKPISLFGRSVSAFERVIRSTAKYSWNWVETAHQSWYYDQMHMIRDSERFRHNTEHRHQPDHERSPKPPSLGSSRQSFGLLAPPVWINDQTDCIYWMLGQP
jgi:hypothetical protein